MLTQDNFTKENIERLQKISGNDPSLLEKTVYAFGLLEAISKVGMPFIFKGGTCLMLLLDKPRRLSTDIDIIVEPGTDVESFIQKAGQIFPFKSQEEDIRKGIPSFLQTYICTTITPPAHRHNTPVPADSSRW